MAQPTTRIFTADQAARVAHALQTSSDVRNFERMRSESSAVREFLGTQEWAAIRAKVMADEAPPIGVPETLADVVRFFRWKSERAAEQNPNSEAAAAYRHAALEVEAYDRRDRRTRRAAPTTKPAPPAVPQDQVRALADAL